MPKRLKTAAIWILLVAAFLCMFQLGSNDEPDYYTEFDEFLQDVTDGRVTEVRVVNNELFVSRYNGDVYGTVGVVDEELTRALSEQGVVIKWGESPQMFRQILIILVPLVLLLAGFLYFVRRARGGSAGDAMALRKSRARLLAEDSKVRFEDVGGLVEAKERLGDVIDFLKHPKPWQESGARLPRGVLLEGPPGCGKTLVARAVAGEAQVPFFLVSASEFVEMFVGIGAARVRDMFEQAAKKAPAVIFIDELDAVGRRRGSGISSAGHDEREQTLNQLLVSLDGFEGHGQLVVIAATNRVDILDKALLRPGRFDVRIRIPELDRDQRIEVFRIHTRNKHLDADLPLDSLADLSTGFTGADIEHIANEAALLAVRRTRDTNGGPVELSLQDFQSCIERSREREGLFDKLDSTLIDSSTQLAQPTGQARVRMTLTDGTVVDGQVVWASTGLVKVRMDRGGCLVVPKMQVRTFEALEGTEPADGGELGDRWALHNPDVG